VPISKGDFLVVDGKHSQSVRQNKDGEQVTYNNMSATTLFRLAGQGAPETAPTLLLLPLLPGITSPSNAKPRGT
jgi:hypothetical protein